MKVGITASAMDAIGSRTGINADAPGESDFETLRNVLGQLKDKVAARALAGVRLDGPIEEFPFAGAALSIIHDWDGSGEPVIMTEEEARTCGGAGWHPGIFHLEL